MMLGRRQTLRGGLSLGALTLLTGCNVSDHDTVQRVLARFSEWNDQVQAALFSQRRLAPTFPEAMAVKDFRYNAWYGPEKAPRLPPGFAATEEGVRAAGDRDGCSSRNRSAAIMSRTMVRGREPRRAGGPRCGTPCAPRRPVATGPANAATGRSCSAANC